MQKRIDLTPTFTAVRSAAALTEGTFLGIGEALASSTSLLSDLADGLESALTELRDEKLGKAAKSLGAAAGQIASFGAAQAAASERFNTMQQVAEAINERVTKMKGSVKSVDTLAINSRVAAANIRGSNIDFSTFSNEIARTLSLTLSSLDAFGSELQAVRAQVASACARQLDFEKEHLEPTRSIPKQLSATLAGMPSQQRRNAKGMATLGKRSIRIQQQVSKAIIALQAGDITRQRLEHIGFALGLMAEAHDLTPREERTFLITTCALQSAQLSATAEEYELNVRKITSSLREIAGEARMLRTLADSSYGSHDHNRVGFIRDLEAQVGAALGLFEGYGAATATAERTMTAASAAAEGLCHHLRAVQSIEDDIRIMGLNTTLQCARIGQEGRALGLIAHELRSYGNQFAREASALIVEVENLARISSSFESSEPDMAALIASVMEAMQDSLGTLRQVSQTLDNAVSILERDTDRVAALLEASAAKLLENESIGEALRDAAAHLLAVSPLDDRPPGFTLAPLAEELLDRMARSYTMANERIVHHRVVGGADSEPSTPVATAASELEDMLF